MRQRMDNQSRGHKVYSYVCMGRESLERSVIVCVFVVITQETCVLARMVCRETGQHAL